MDLVSTWLPEPRTALIVTTTAVATTTFLVLAKATLWPRREKTLANPLRTVIPRTPKSELAGLVYQPDQYPGARDVETPYGMIRVYEFGPEDGPKVLLIHGISTTCVTLGAIAEGLVRRGCRVMLFDLFGRGFSDGVGDLPHDARLYVSQALLALASSPLPWTGDGALRVIGYSLGGGIAVRFAATFPRLVASLVLLAPAGLIRAKNFGVVSRFIFSSGIVPERLIAYLAHRRLQQPIASSKAKRANVPPTAAAVAIAEAADPAKGEAVLPIERRVLMYVRWMVINHVGFVPAFMSSIRYAPLVDQHEAWRQLAKRERGSTMILLAEHDEIIDLKDFRQDAPPLIGGKDNVVWRELPGGHDLPMTHVPEIFVELDEFWNMEA